MRNNIFKTVMIITAAVIFLVPPSLSYAWRGDHWRSSFGVNLSFGPWWPDRYYYHDYVYYPEDYVVVQPPVVYQQPVTTVVQSVPAVVQPASPAAGNDNSFTVNIPNDSGGYTVVTLQRSGSGFTGPQGEFYPEFPKVSQLKAMYAK